MRVEGAGREAVVSGSAFVSGRRRFRGGHVDDDGTVECVGPQERAQVGGEGGDQLPVVAVVAGERAAGPYGFVRRGQFGPHGARQTVREYAARREFLGPFGQRVRGGVVTAEHEGGQGRQRNVVERRGLGDHAGRRVQPGGDGGAAGDHGRRDRPPRPDQPHSRTPATASDALAGTRPVPITVPIPLHTPACPRHPLRPLHHLPPFAAVSYSFTRMLRKEIRSSSPWFWMPMWPWRRLRAGSVFVKSLICRPLRYTRSRSPSTRSS